MEDEDGLRRADHQLIGLLATLANIANSTVSPSFKLTAYRWNSVEFATSAIGVHPYDRGVPMVADFHRPFRPALRRRSYRPPALAPMSLAC